jgi:hypothetical protein
MNCPVKSSLIVTTDKSGVLHQIARLGVQPADDGDG